MTRKQALKQALGILENQKQTKEIKEIQNKITEIINDLPITTWTKNTIFDAFNQFTIDNGRNATSTDMKKRGLPPHPVIKLRFGIEAKEFLNTYYPSKCDSKIYNHKSKEEWLEFFKKEYERIKPSSAEEYNEKRETNSPVWQTISRLYNITKWVEFQDFCNIPAYKKDKTIKPNIIPFKVNRHTDLDIEFEKISNKTLSLI